MVPLEEAMIILTSILYYYNESVFIRISGYFKVEK